MSERPDSAREEALRWLTLAQGDLRTAQTVLDHQEDVLRNAAFLAQQSAEKALKALLAADDLEVPRTHRLLLLLRLLPEPPSGLSPDDLELLEPWVTDGRYPADIEEAPRDEVEEVVEAARRVLAVVQQSVTPARDHSPGDR